MPYSGPLSALSTTGKAQSAYFDMINAGGGVNGRKIKLISLDDGYNPARTVEQTRKMIEGEGVLALFSPLGNNVLGYSVAELMVYMLRQCGDDLSRDNLLDKPQV